MGHHWQSVLVRIGSSRAFSARPENVPTDITASALAGVLVASGSGQLDTGRFQLKSRLTDADFRCMLQDLGDTTAPTDALCNVELAISGVPWEPQDLQWQRSDSSARCQAVRVADHESASCAHYRSRLLTRRLFIQLISSLISTVIKFLWSSSATEICSVSRAVAKTNFRKDLDLEVYSYVGGRVPVSSVFAPIVRKASYASLMSFHVSGTIDNPQLGRATFQQLNMVPQIFPDKLSDTDTPESSGRLIDRLRR